MVRGCSYCVGSSGLSGSCISCTSAFPLEVTRIVTCVCVPFPMLGSGGSVVTEPCHVPERLLSRLKDFWASVGTGLSAGLFASDCAKARVASDIRTRGRRKRTDFMFGSPSHVVGTVLLVFTELVSPRPVMSSRTQIRHFGT